MITVLHEQNQSSLPNAQAAGDSLWLDRHAIEQTLGWTWKPEGLCQGEICVPISPRNASTMVRDDRLDIAAMWRQMGQPVVHDDQSQTWVFGAGAAQRGQTLDSLNAPDFELPDLDGRSHRLSDYRGTKVLIVTWASW
jgi:hypothetical protein